MAAIYEDRARLSRNPAFLDRVKVAFVDASFDILNEADNTEHHAERVALANLIVKDPENAAKRYYSSIAFYDGTAALCTGTGDTLSFDGDDQALFNIVAALWNRFAL